MPYNIGRAPGKFYFRHKIPCLLMVLLENVPCGLSLERSD